MLTYHKSDECPSINGLFAQPAGGLILNKNAHLWRNTKYFNSKKINFGKRRGHFGKNNTADPRQNVAFIPTKV
jgi:hypothetical protein